MTRRQAVALISSSLAFVGFRSCEQRQNQLALMTETLGNAIAKLLDVMGDTEAATRLRAHTDTAVALLRAWKPGMSGTDIIRALNRIIDDLIGVNVADRFRPLVTFALGTIAAIIESIRQQSGGQGEEPHTKVRLTSPPKTDSDLRRDWDCIRAGSPNMEQAPVL